MYPCFIICRILGTFPYKINGSVFEISRPRYILSTVVVCVNSICNLISIYNLISTTNSVNVIKILESLCYCMCSNFILIITHVLSGPRMRLLQTILNISLKLSSKSYQNLSRLIYIKDTFSTITVIVQICVYFFKTFDYSHILNTVLAIYYLLLIFQTNMLYINCVYILKACFKDINDNLRHMQRLVINDTKSCVPTFINHLQRNQFLIITKLKALKKWHLMISDAVQMLNIIFSGQLLATMVLIFSNTTFELYFFIVRWQDNGILISFDRHLFDTFLMVFVYHILHLTLIVWVCETGKYQAQEIRTTIHDLLNNTSDEQIKDEVIKMQLYIFF
ncbi:PREDICTED: uncharacterized protein LOC105462056 [Wasmannia auropunctata]|uniref:uncharacterized protein LOC105462056 n=1 Tax=Wasmannia auropunctata TaxID=64793 RepID=UPI0005EF3DAF|nr:PREDICTED: uncharacterized protein LOC105462056 [Wasmannia auropunctata]